MNPEIITFYQKHFSYTAENKPPETPKALEPLIGDWEGCNLKEVDDRIILLAEIRTIIAFRQCQEDPKKPKEYLYDISCAIGTWQENWVNFSSRLGHQFSNLTTADETIINAYQADLVSLLYQTYALLQLNNLSSEAQEHLHSLHHECQKLWTANNFNIRINTILQPAPLEKSA